MNPNNSVRLLSLFRRVGGGLLIAALLLSSAGLVMFTGASSNTPFLGQYTITVKMEATTAGTKITVNWQAPPGSSSQDWLGVYLVGSPDRSSLWWAYTNGQTTGSITFQAPKVVGQCEFRYYMNNGYALAARSPAFVLSASNTPAPLGDAIPARDSQFVLRDYLQRSWENELVFFDVSADVHGKAGYRLESGGGADIPFQWAERDGRPAIAFLATVPALGQSTYRLVPGVPVITTDVSVSDQGAYFELKNNRTGVRIRKENSAYAAGPIAGIRLNSGAWVGGGRLILRAAPIGYQARIAAQGAVFVDVEAQYALPANQFWKLRFRVIANEPVVLVDESFSGEIGAVYELSLNPGLNADQMFWRKENLAAGAQAIGSINGENAFLLEPWYHWWEGDYQGDWVSFYNNAGPDLLGVAARDAAAWVDPVKTEWEYRVPIGKSDLTMRMQLRGLERRWMLFALNKTQALQPQSDAASIPQQLKIKHGEFPLDQLSRASLVWQDTGLIYPRLFAGPAEIAALRATQGTSQNLSRFQRDSYRINTDDLDEYIPAALTTNDPVLRGRLAADAVERLQQTVDLYLRQTQYRTAGHDLSRHYNDVAITLNMLDAALSFGLYTPAEMQRIRGQVAFLGNVLANPIVVSPERGFSGNPNMTSSTRSVLGVLASLIPDHPQARAWADLSIQQISRDLAASGSEQGGWIEAPHYAGVALDSILASALALTRNGLANRSLLQDPKLKGALRWIAHITTPRDPMLQGLRHMPAIGNTYLGEQTSLPGWAAFIWKDQDPAFSREMQWIWREQNFFPRAGIGGLYPGTAGFTRFILNATLPAAPPQWGSEVFPETGAVFRAHFPGPQETYLHYIQGPLHQHYDYDEGSIVLWGQGQPLIEEFGYYDRAPAAYHSRVEDGFTEQTGNEGRIREFLTSPDGDYLRGERAGWQRQILFVKDTQALGPNYFVLHDTLTHGREGMWRAWISTNETPAGIATNSSVLRARGRFNVDLAMFLSEPAARGLTSNSFTVENGASGYTKNSITQRSVEFRIPAGGQSTVALYPISSPEPLPAFSEFGGGKAIKIVGPWGVDYVFLNLTPFTASQDTANFNGRAGILQIRAGLVRMTLIGKGQLSFANQSLSNDQNDSQILRKEFSR